MALMLNSRMSTRRYSAEALCQPSKHTSSWSGRSYIVAGQRSAPPLNCSVRRMAKRRRTPSEKKAISYSRDRRNVYGENSKSSRNSIRVRKRLRVRAEAARSRCRNGNRIRRGAVEVGEARLGRETSYVEQSTRCPVGYSGR
jgi:hypothetical protein